MEQVRDDQLQQIAENCKGSTVCLKTTFIGLTVQVGSGFFVAPDKVATNIHVIEGVPGFNVKAITAKQFEIEKVPISRRISKMINNLVPQLFGGILKRLKAKRYQKPDHLQIGKETAVYTIEGVVAFDANNDLVLLKVAEIGVPLPIGNCHGLQSGDQVYIVGYDNKQYKSIAGTISGGHNSDKLLQIKVKLPTEQIDGYSGGPVLNGSGEIIGVVESAVGSGSKKHSVSGFSFVHAIPLTVLKTLMTNSGHIESITGWRRHPQIRAYTKTDLGNTKFKAGKYKQAIAYYDAALRLNPSLADTYFKRATAKCKLGDYEGTIEDYDMAIQFNPEDANYYNNRGIEKDNLRDFEGAIEDYDMAIRLNSEDADFYYNRGISKKALNDLEGAIADYDNAIRLSPEYVRAYNNRGNAKSKLGDVESAIEDYSDAIRVNPEYIKAYNNRGNAKRKLGNFADAIADYDMAIKLKPEYANAYNNRGKAKKAVGQQKEAEADFAKAMELDPDFENKSN